MTGSPDPDEAAGRSSASRFLGLIGRWGWLAAVLAVLPLLIALYRAPPATDRPLPDGPLKSASVALLARAGVAGTPIVVRPGGGPCAWGTVAGLGGAQHIVISPGALNYPLDETLWTIAHEAGHVRRGDPLLGVFVGWVWIALAIASGQGVAVLAVRRWGWPGLAAFAVGFALVWIAGVPVFNLIQRQVERRADRFGVEVAGSGASAAAMIQRSSACFGGHETAGLYETLFTLNHPTTRERILTLRSMETR